MVMQLPEIKIRAKAKLTAYRKELNELSLLLAEFIEKSEKLQGGFEDLRYKIATMEFEIIHTQQEVEKYEEE